MIEGWYEANRALWDERVPIHVESTFYDNEGWLAGRRSLRAFEPDELGDVSGRTLFHPQCHFGQDTLAWARRGAIVTGLDFSEPAIAAARDLATQAGIGDATFVCADVYDAPDAVGAATFDIVYTGFGALELAPRHRAVGGDDGLGLPSRRRPLPRRVPSLRGRVLGR